MNIKKIKQTKSIQELLEFGIINIDKPAGMTSFDVSNFVKKINDGIKKVINVKMTNKGNLKKWKEYHGIKDIKKRVDF